MNGLADRRFGRWIRGLHALDFGHGLPWFGRLPMTLGHTLGEWRGWMRGRLYADWRSLALGYPHIAARSLQVYRELAPETDDVQLRTWLLQRFSAEARDELEARWIAEGRCNDLHCRVLPDAADLPLAGRDRGLVLLTAHWHSFFIGIAFLARRGAKVNVMTSAVTSHPLVARSVTDHFRAKYAGLARELNGGQLIDFENGLRPFFRMLERGEVVVVLADAPVLPNGARIEAPFLGARRVLAGGAVRIAERTDSDLGAFVCAASAPRHYTLALSAIGPAREGATVEAAYGFLSDAILRDPGGWWAADLLPDMPAATAAAPAAVSAPPPDETAPPPALPPYAVLALTDSALAGSAELDFGRALLRRSLHGANPPQRWIEGHAAEVPESAALLAELQAAGCARLLVLTHSAVSATAGLVHGLEAALAATPAACASAVTQHNAGVLEPAYVTLADFETYVVRRQALPPAEAASAAAAPVFWLDVAAAQAALATEGGALTWAGVPARLAAHTVLAPRAYVHDYADYRRHERADMLALLPAGVQRLLDVGGGEGVFARAVMRERGAQVWLLEPDATAAARAREAGLQVVESRLEALGDEHDGRFDAVTLLDVLEHMEDPRAALARVRRLLRPGGTLLVSTPNVGHWPIVRDLAAGRFDYLPVGSLCWTHLRFFTEASLHMMLQEAGFSIDAVGADTAPTDPGGQRFAEAVASAGVAVDRASLQRQTLRVRARVD